MNPELTDCCQAAATFFEATLVCKGCYNEVESADDLGLECFL